MGTDEPSVIPEAWLSYLERHLQAKYGDLSRRGWRARFAADAGLDDGSVSRYMGGQKIPDIPTCRKIAKALRRPMLEVVVAAGHLDREEARMRDLPKAALPAQPALSPELDRLRRLRDDPSTDPATRKRLDSILSDVADLIERAG